MEGFFRFHLKGTVTFSLLEIPAEKDLRLGDELVALLRRAVGRGKAGEVPEEVRKVPDARLSLRGFAF